MKKYFLTGLAILLPLAVTLAVLGFIIKFLTEPFIDLVSHFLSRLNIINTGFLFLTPEQLLKYGSELLILILLFLFILGLGILARWFFLHALIGLGDKILQRIPLVNTVYKTSRDITKTLFAADKKTLKEVVMVPFPKSGIYVLGLIAREAPDTCSDAVKEELISVFVPTTPNPMSGFLLMYKRQDLIRVDMRAEDAFKYIISCGVIHPPEKT